MKTACQKRRDPWTEATLDELATNLDHKRIPITKADRVAGEYPYYGASGIVDYVAEYIFDGDSLLVSEDGANLLLRSTPIAFSVSGKYWVNNHAHVLKFRNTVTQKFVEHYLESIKLDEYVTGAAQPKLNQKALNSILIPIPERMEEQERIVAILDEAFAGIATTKANTEANLQNTRALFRSELDQLFLNAGDNWRTQTLAELTTKIGSGATPAGGGNSYKQSGISLIRSMNVHDVGFKFDDLAFIDDKQADKLSSVVVQQDDVLLNVTGASVARCCNAPLEVLPARVNQHVLILRPRSNVLRPRFLRFLLNSKPYKSRLLQAGDDGGSTRQAITKAQMQAFSIAFPADPVEQDRIADRCDDLLVQTQSAQSIQHRKLATLDELKQSLLHRAFAGEL